MPLRCFDSSGKSIQSFAMSDAEWNSFKEENSRLRHLSMCCCSERVVLKTSKLGTRFFAHARRGDCQTAPETEHHLALKMIVARAVLDCGWSITTEAPGETPDGEKWIADVLATQGNAKVAIEVQWSSQTNEETLFRQERYRQSGVRGLWLLRKPGFPITKALPAVCIQHDEVTGAYHAMLPKWEHMHSNDRKFPERWAQTLPVYDLIVAAFNKRLRFGFGQAGDIADVKIWADWCKCWRCNLQTRVVTHIDVEYGGETFSLPLDEMDNSIVEDIGLKNLHANHVGQIKSRFSKTEGEAYMSNGCVHCDALQGKFFLDSLVDSAAVLFTAKVTLSSQMIALLDEWYTPHWKVC